MFNRFNSSIPVLCVSSLLLIGGCGDTPSASTSTSTAQSSGGSADASGNEETSAPESTATAGEAPAAQVRSQLSAASEQVPPSLSTARDASTTTPRSNPAATATQPPQTGEIVVVAEPAVLDLGEMAINGTATGVVTLRNTGDKPMTVRDSKTSCGCTVANVPKGQELQPGESVEVEVSMRGGSRPGHLSKTVDFMVDGQAPMRVRVEANTVAYVVIEPSIIQLDELPDGQIVVRADDGEPFRITAMHPQIAEELPTEPQTEHVLTLSKERWEETGQSRRLLFYIDHPKVTQVTSSIRVPVNRAASAGQPGNTAQPRQVRLTPESMIAQNKTEEFLAELTEGKVDVEATDRAGTTLIGVAAKQGNVEIIQALIAAGADIEAADRQGRTPLMHAAQSKKPEAVRMLLQAGAAVDTRDTTLANTALSWAAGFGDAQSVRELIDAGAQVEVVSNATGFTPLILAAGFGEPDSIRHLIEAGAQIEATDTLQGYTPIMYAASTGKVDNIRALLEGEANLEAKDPNGRTVLLVAASAAGANASTIQALLDAGADVKAVDRSGLNALQHAQGRTDPRRDEVVAVLEPVMVATSE